MPYTVRVHRIFRKVHAALGRVALVVKSDAEDGGGLDRGQELVTKNIAHLQAKREGV